MVRLSPLGGRCRGSPPEKIESEKSLWKTDGWFYLPRRRSSDKERVEKACFNLFPDIGEISTDCLCDPQMEAAGRCRMEVGDCPVWG